MVVRLIPSTNLECPGLATYLQRVSELKYTALSHELHDELGELMGAAMMDLNALQRVSPPLNATALVIVERAKRSLEQAILLKRRITEELRPSILDNFGLFAALRWQLTKTWSSSTIVATQSFPEIEPEIESNAAIALFRCTEEALAIALLHSSVTLTDFNVKADSHNLWMRFSDNGTTRDPSSLQDPELILASMRNRIRLFGGNVEITRSLIDGTTLTLWMPIPIKTDTRA
jgi:signal transduction histidine kinase